MTDRVLVMTTRDLGNAHTLTNAICSELTSYGLPTFKNLSQVCDEVAVKSGKHSKVQRLLLEREGKEIQYMYYVHH